MPSLGFTYQEPLPELSAVGLGKSTATGRGMREQATQAQKLKENMTQVQSLQASAAQDTVEMWKMWYLVTCLVDTKSTQIMDVDSSTSSDSELDARIKFRPNIKKSSKKKGDMFSDKSCIICKGSGQLVQSRETSKQRFIDCTKIRMDICKGSDASLKHLISNFNCLKDQEYLSWHRNCYKTYTSAKNITSYKSMYDKIVTDMSTTDARQKRSTRTQFDGKMCLFCQKRIKGQKLCQVMSKNMEHKIKRIARNNPKFCSRIGESDLIASEIKYHGTCLTSELRHISKNEQGDSANGRRNLNSENEALQRLLTEMEQGFEKGKVYTTTAVSKRYREIDGNVELSDRLLIKKITEYFKNDIELVKSVRQNEPRMFVKKFSKQQAIDTIIHYAETETSSLTCGASELQILTKICQNIRSKIEKIPKNADLANLRISDYRRHIPDDLYLIISLLVSNEPSRKTKEIEILNICQDIIFACSNRKKYTPKHIGLGLLVHQETRSKKLVEALHSCGHSISYTDTLRVRKSIAQEEIQLYLENDHATVPRQLVPDRFVHFAADNIDILEETLDKTPTFHGTQIAAFQRGPPNTSAPRKFEILPYNVRLNIPNDFHVLEKSHFNKIKK
ncbi:unnamed protein product [Callosobruchus maculatus]|uniref:Uncharacterized protein n=1 Tax=Callosobruchus maculatus TaxID=64391 RepID=A0A653BLB8_CALMS|nr:unnamed protein product [Callosobruchus maculatus]